MTFMKYLFLGAALGLFQGSLEMAWSLGGPAPDLLLVYVIWLGMRRQTTEAMLVAFVGGLVVDGVAYYEPMGIRSLLKVTVAYLPEWAHYILLPENRLTGWLLVGGGTTLQQVLLLTIIQTLRAGEVWGIQAVWDTGLLIAWNLVCWMILTAVFSPVTDHGTPI